VDNHGLVAELDERLREGKGERAEAGAKTADEDESLHDCRGAISTLDSGSGRIEEKGG